MPKVTVPRRGITADDAAAAIRNALGDAVEVTGRDGEVLRVKRNWFVRAHVKMAEEPGGTTFSIRGSGPPTPLGIAVMAPINNAGIAKRLAAAIEQHAAFRNGND
jgi:hypothetical protein